jgi:putative ABC transport system substrate-binding protein
MIQLHKTIVTGIKVAITTAILLFGLAHTSLFNYVMQKKERAAVQRIMALFKPHAIIPPKKLAVFCPAEIAAIDEMLVAAFDLCSAQGMQLDVKKFYYHGDLALLKGQIEESILWQADACISVGCTPAETAHAVLTKRQSKIPHIFACITDPVELGISTSKYVTGTTSTGTAEDPAGILDGFVRSFKHVRPDARTVLIFTSGNGPQNNQDMTNLIEAFNKHSIAARSIHTANIEEVTKCAQAYITRDIDAVIILRDFVVVSALQSIIKACRMHGVTAFASDSGSVTNGAAAGCCVGEAELGLLLGEIILKVVHHKMPCSEVPITYFTTSQLYRTHVNQFEMHQQGLNNRSIYDLMSGESKLEFLRRRP